jgi:lysophospholipase L1-like esterase
MGIYGDPSQGTFDGSDDTLVGVINLTGHAIDAIPLQAKVRAFGFDGDGLCVMTPRPDGCPFGPTGYEGPGVTFSNISADATAGTVNFAGGLQPGASAYFSLEEALALQPPYDIGPARSLRYVAMGDSYSSGEGAGAGNYFQWQETRYRCTSQSGRTIDGYRKPMPIMDCTPYQINHDVGCHRAPSAWSFKIASRSLEIADSSENIACSGATISKNLLDKPKENEQPQTDKLKSLDKTQTVDLVTFTISGNDLGFSDIITDCFLRLGGTPTCAGVQNRVAKKLKKLDLVTPIMKIHQAAPQATIAYVSYPQLVPDTQAETTNCSWLGADERFSLRSLVGKINLAEYNAVQKAKAQIPGLNVVFVDISDALKGHEICTANSHVVKIYGNKFNSEQGHPNALGQQNLADAVFDGLIKQGVISG